MIRLFTNNQIYKIATIISENPFKNDTYIPIKFNFYIQRNIEAMLQEYQKIEKHRNDIFKHYGTMTGDQFTIPQEKIEEVNKELESLGEIKQEVNITMIPLSAIEELSLTTGELKSIMFMIDDEAKERENLSSLISISPGEKVETAVTTLPTEG